MKPLNEVISVMQACFVPRPAAIPNFRDKKTAKKLQREHSSIRPIPKKDSKRKTPLSGAEDPDLYQRKYPLPHPDSKTQVSEIVVPPTLAKVCTPTKGHGAVPTVIPNIRSQKTERHAPQSSKVIPDGIHDKPDLHVTDAACKSEKVRKDSTLQNVSAETMLPEREYLFTTPKPPHQRTDSSQDPFRNVNICEEIDISRYSKSAWQEYRQDKTSFEVVEEGISLTFMPRRRSSAFSNQTSRIVCGNVDDIWDLGEEEVEVLLDTNGIDKKVHH